MSTSDDLSPLDPIRLTEQAIRCLQDGRLDEAAQYLKVAKSQITDKLATGDPMPLRPVKAKDVITH